MKRTLIHNALIVNEGQTIQGSVVITDQGRIAEVLTHGKPLSAPCDETIDATGCYLLPGAIDDHVHFRDPGLTHKADILSESRAAAAGGVTSIMDMPNTLPQTTTLEALDAKLNLLDERCIVNHSAYFGATNNNYGDFARLDRSRVCGIKLFMGSSTGNMLVDRMESLRAIFGSTDLLIAVHCEDPAIIRKNTEKYKAQYADEDDVPVNKHPNIRSSAACYASSSLAVKLARETGARLHVLHLSTARELSLLEAGPVSGKKITGANRLPHAGHPHQMQPRGEDQGRPRRPAPCRQRRRDRRHRHRPCSPPHHREEGRRAESRFGHADGAVLAREHAPAGK